MHKTCMRYVYYLCMVQTNMCSNENRNIGIIYKSEALELNSQIRNKLPTISQHQIVIKVSINVQTLTFT